MHNPEVPFCDAPVVDAFESNGRMIPVACAGDYSAIVRNMRLLTKSVPQASEKPQRQKNNTLVLVST